MDINAYMRNTPKPLPLMYLSAIAQSCPSIEIQESDILSRRQHCSPPEHQQESPQEYRYYSRRDIFHSRIALLWEDSLDWEGAHHSISCPAHCLVLQQE